MMNVYHCFQDANPQGIEIIVQRKFDNVEHYIIDLFKKLYLLFILLL
jgi:hypothetical protein